MAARLHVHFRVRAFTSSSSPLLSSSPKILALSRTRPAMPLAAHARRRFGSSSAAAADVDDGFASAADLRFEAPLKIVEYPDPVLRARNKRINTFDDNLRRLSDEMFDVMYETDGIGLSAPQVGVNVQLMVFNPAGVRSEGEEIVLVNPVVYKFSKRLLMYEEGCLSFPGIYANVERPATVKIDARDITGEKFKVNLSGLSARVFQHEFDHLQSFDGPASARSRPPLLVIARGCSGCSCVATSQVFISPNASTLARLLPLLRSVLCSACSACLISGSVRSSESARLRGSTSRGFFSLIG